MHAALIKGLVALIPTSMLFVGSMVLFLRAKRVWTLLQLVGAAGFLIVVFTHICEALHLFPSMGWGFEHSAGHYLDLVSAIIGLTMFPLGYLCASFRSAHLVR